MKKYDKIRQEKKFKKIVEVQDKMKKNTNISILEEVNSLNDKKTRE